MNETKQIIRIAAAVILDGHGRMLLVRKRGTRAFIQPGGKMEPGETTEGGLRRELREELNCAAVKVEFISQLSAPAVNEAGHIVEAAIFQVTIEGQLSPAREIEEIMWVNPASPGEIEMAPLTRDKVLPLVLSRL
jgi:8-oxo-dGTP diphosphatase